MFKMFLLLNLLVLAVFVFAEQGMKTGDVKKVLCGEDYKDYSAMAMECYDTVEHSFIKDTKDCFDGVDGESAENFKSYYCSHEVEELERDEDCATKWLEENDRAEEIINMKKDIAHCVINKMNPEDERK